MRIGFAALCLLLVAVTVPAAASTSTGFTHADHVKLCRNARVTVRMWWQKDLYAAPPAVSAIMLAAIDGQTSNVRKGLANLPPDEVVPWRLTALATAVTGNQPGTVQALIADGADPNARAVIPPFTAAFYRQTVDSMKKDPRWGGPKVVDGLKKSGLMRNQEMRLSPPLFQAAFCDEGKVISALLRGGAAINATALANGHGMDALMSAVDEGNAEATRVLLDHGAEPCIDDRHMAAHMRRLKRKPHTLAGIGQREGLPPALVKRLTCDQPTSAG